MMVGDGGWDHFVLLKARRRFLSFFVTPDNVESVSGPSEDSLGISRADPPAELFEVPEEYKEIPFEYPLSWSGPLCARAYENAVVARSICRVRRN
jgi:hypothetical protein